MFRASIDRQVAALRSLPALRGVRIYGFHAPKKDFDQAPTASCFCAGHLVKRAPSWPAAGFAAERRAPIPQRRCTGRDERRLRGRSAR